MKKVEENQDLLPYRRQTDHRIFVNRNLYFDKINFFGFDMDYTLAEYKSPDYERLIYKYVVNTLVQNGYPKELLDVEYDPSFAARGLVFDKYYGNFLKVDTYGNILTAVHGLKYLELSRSRYLYRNRFIEIGDSERYAIQNTLFELSSVFLISSTINFFENSPGFKLSDNERGIELDDMSLTYENIYKDIISAVDIIHKSGDMKKETVENIEKYIKKDERLPILFKRMQNAGKKPFIVTNSEYWYTNSVMTYLFQGADKLGDGFSEDWKSYFEIIVVDAVKPLFFASGTCMCQVDTTTGRKHIGRYKGKTNKGDVFAGGNSMTLSDLLGAQGKDILYVGDHIYGDILKSKKKQGWRTYLVVPELLSELNVWINEQSMYERIRHLEVALTNIYRHLDNETCVVPKEAIEKREKIRDSTIAIEKSYGRLGSLFRCGTQHTFFASQMMRYADLYAHTCLNLIYYPFCYLFRTPAALMAHEATVISPLMQMHAKTDSDNHDVKPSPYKNFTICYEEQQGDEDLSSTPESRRQSMQS